MKSIYLILIILVVSLAANAQPKTCITCHSESSPGVVADWKLSKHAENGITCEDCHGAEHNTAENYRLAKLPTPQTCNQCHEEQVTQFSKGKHAMAWTAQNAMPTIHWQPMSLIDGMKGCGACHKIGLKSDDEIKKLNEQHGGHGNASCDACHTRHTFSVEEARQPQACQTCHMGFDHPQWEMYSSSKHGVRHGLKQMGILPESASAPTCQDCHMQNGNHEVRTAWGFLAVRLPMPEDSQWTADRVTILQALGVLDPTGQPTGRLDAVKAADLARLTQEDFDRERNKMIATCSQCHAKTWATDELAKGDDMIKNADRLMAEAIRIVAGLYSDNIIPKPSNYANNFPDLLTFHDAPSVIEQTLFVMFLEHRMRTFQGTFHANPDYALWYGWSEMQRDLQEIKEHAAELRAKH
jgi:hydroxylamine dehydrogenase